MTVNRLRINFMHGQLAAAISDSATTVTSTRFITLPEIVEGVGYLPITINPGGEAPEIAWIIAHDTNGASAEVLRGQEGTDPIGHADETPWVHAPTVFDIDRIATVVNLDTDGSSTIYVGTTEPTGMAPGDVWLTPTSAEDPRFVTLPARYVPSTAYTLVIGDAGKVVEMDHVDPGVVTIPDGPWPVGAIVEVFRGGPGAVAIEPDTGVNLFSPGGLRSIAPQYGSAVLRHRGDNTWVLDGRLE